MDKVSIPVGDFLKNAGIVGFNYMLKVAGAKNGVDFGISENGQELWVDLEYALNADWTNMYFNACINYFGPFTVYQGALDKIQSCIDKIQTNDWNPGKDEKDDLKFINEKLLSNSYQSAFENIKNDIENPEVYLRLKKDKLNDKILVEELCKRLIELQQFLMQLKCKEAFIMKSVIYTYINRFWDGKSFLLRSNAKKDMWEMFEKDFSEPFRKYLSTDHKKAKDLCIDCGTPILPKEKVSIAFMKEVGDDFTRKRSAFWNCKVDAFLCPVCAFVYALSPLGFRLFANKFVFVNINNNVSTLLEVNDKAEDASKEVKKEKNQKYSQWFATTINMLLKEKIKEISNVQVILRGIKSEDRYLLSIIPRSMLEIVSENKVSKALELLGNYPYAKIKNEFVNIHEEVIMNLLKRCNQYQLLNRLLKANIEEGKLDFYVDKVYNIQIWSDIVKIKKEKGKEIAMIIKDVTYAMKMSGADLRNAIMFSKGVSSDECLRGIEYQLLNALSVRNTDKFMDIVLRLYSAYGSKKNGEPLLIPNGLVTMLMDKEKFIQYGYAFVMGLEGCYSDENKEKKIDDNSSKGGRE